MMSGLETLAIDRRQEAELEMAELKMLRFSLGVTRMDRIRNEVIRGTTQTGRYREQVKMESFDLLWQPLKREKL